MPIQTVRRPLSAVATAALLALGTAPVSAQGLTPQQVMNLRYVTAVLPSPDGARLACVVRGERGPDEPPGPGRSEAFVMPADGGARIAVPGTSGLAWRPDGALVTWVARRDGDPAPQLYGMPPDGGAEQRLTSSALGIGSYAWRPDGTAIAFTRLDPLPSARAQDVERGFRQIVVDEDEQPISLWLLDLATGTERRLTQGGTVQSFRWSPDGERLAIGLSPHNTVDDSYMFVRLWQVVPSTGALTRLVDNPGKLGTFRWSPDGRRLAYVSAADRRDPHDGMLYVVDRESGAVTPLTEGLLGMVEDVHWLDDRHLDALVAVGVDTFLRTFSLDDVARVGPDRTVGISAPVYRAAPAGTAIEPLGATGRYAIAASAPDCPPEAFVERPDGSWRRLTDSNPWLADVRLGQQEVVRFRARDGLPIEGLLLHPVGPASSERRPLVIVAHGGPESHYSNGWLTRYSEPGQVLAGRGYRVWYPNYRGSTGYGVAFAKADHGDPMGREFEDHLDAIASFDARGIVDPERVGIIGGSYGGYTAAWAATRHSEHFAAAVSFVPFVDIRTKWLTSDIPYEFYHVHYEELWPHEQTGFLADRSPLTWAPQCRTPLLLCGGTSDPRVHPSQPFMLYRAVKFATDTPVRYVQYPGEGHGNATDVYRYDYMLRALRWLEHYLGERDSRRRPLPPADLEHPAWR
ncbi:MAG: S9 family peptidase [Planctomycetes bacterium]|nr:S9 family peptidase [Planctomycetota bacterium]